jgi:hypothetical protein
MNKIKLVKYDYESLPENWRRNNPNPFKDQIFALIGEIENMPGHSYLQNIKTGIPIILHTDNLIELNEDEL